MSERVKIVEINGVEYLIVDEEPKQETLEFRLYYDENGRVLSYSCEKLDGRYIVIDKQTYIEARPDWIVVDGKLTKYVPGVIISKLKPNLNDGTSCLFEDISIVSNDKNLNLQKWKTHIYELR